MPTSDKMSRSPSSNSNTPQPHEFPVTGIIGVIGESVSELDHAVQKKLSSVEIRADLLLDTGCQPKDIEKLIRDCKHRGISSLTTLRHHSQGGKFDDSEETRITLVRRFLAAGTDIIDLEWNTDAAHTLLADGVPMILSYHNFSAMEVPRELATLTQNMQSPATNGHLPAAIKVVPTADNIADAVAMLDWVQAAESDIRRIGFAMGACAASSRILTIGYGSPVTYASFGAPVAPGQIDIDDLMHRYKAAQVTRTSRSLGLLCTDTDLPEALNSIAATAKVSSGQLVPIPLSYTDLPYLEKHHTALRLDAIYVHRAANSDTPTPGFASTAQQLFKGGQLNCEPYSDQLD